MEIGNSLRDVKNIQEKQTQWHQLISEKILSKLRDEVLSLSVPHRNTAAVLFAFLSRVASRTETKMTADNLAICWAPNLFGTPPKLSPHEGLMHMPFTKSIVSTLIEFDKEVFVSCFHLL